MTPEISLVLTSQLLLSAKPQSLALYFTAYDLTKDPRIFLGQHLDFSSAALFPLVLCLTNLSCHGIPEPQSSMPIPPSRTTTFSLGSSSLNHGKCSRGKSRGMWRFPCCASFPSRTVALRQLPVSACKASFLYISLRSYSSQIPAAETW